MAWRELVAGDDVGFERQHDQRQRAVFRQQLAADDLVGFDGLDEFVVVGALGQSEGNSAAGSLPGAGAWRAENSEIRPRVPSTSCRSVTRVAQLLEIVARQQRLAFDHDQHVEFGRRESAWFPPRIAGIPCWSGTAG